MAEKSKPVWREATNSGIRPSSPHSSDERLMTRRMDDKLATWQFICSGNFRNIIKKIAGCGVEASAKFGFEFRSERHGFFTIQCPLADAKQNETHEFLLPRFWQIFQSAQKPKRKKLALHLANCGDNNRFRHQRIRINQDLALGFSVSRAASHAAISRLS